MKILVCSDSHGMRYNIKDAYEKERLDGVFFLGDGLRDTEILSLPQTSFLAAVKGNCDFGYEDDERCFVLENKKLLLTHGHKYRVKQGLWSLDYLAREKEADIIFYGHTHQKLETVIENRVYICPGSISQGDYVILELKNGEAIYTFKSLY